MSSRESVQRGFPGLSLPRYEIDIAKGFVAGRVAVERHGHNLVVAATEETIWGDSSLYTYLTAAEQVKVSSSVPATDVPASTGAWTVLIRGLDPNYRFIEETVTLLNPGPATTVLSFLRVFCVQVMTAGTGGKNAGIISVKDNADVVTLAYMAAGENMCHAAIWTVPSRQRFILLEWHGGELAAKVSHILLYIREYEGVWQLKRDVILKDNYFYLPMLMPTIIPAQADIELRCTATAGSGIIFGGFSGFYEDIQY